MYKLAITGGIGSGKTTVSNFIYQNYKSVYLFNAHKRGSSILFEGAQGISLDVSKQSV